MCACDVCVSFMSLLFAFCCPVRVVRLSSCVVARGRAKLPSLSPSSHSLPWRLAIMPGPAAGAASSAPSPPPAVCLVRDLPSERYDSLVAHARAALGQAALSPQSPCEVALAVKRGMEAETGDLWHVVVGAAFGASVSHEAGCYASFRLSSNCVLAWSSLDEATLVRGKRAFVPAAARAALAEPGEAVGAAND